LPDLVDHPSGAAEASEHFRACPDCAAELRAYRAVVAAAAEFGVHDAPDPGPEYWDAFLPSVKDRIARRAARSPRPGIAWWVPAAAALVMTAATVGVLVMSGGPRRVTGATADRAGALAVDEASRRVDEALGRMPALSGVLTADLIGTDPLPGIGAKDILDALKELDRAPGLFSAWGAPDEDDLQRQLAGLDASQASKLRAELVAERG
jgi:hypothetical protein